MAAEPEQTHRLPVDPDLASLNRDLADAHAQPSIVAIGSNRCAIPANDSNPARIAAAEHPTAAAAAAAQAALIRLCRPGTRSGGISAKGTGPSRRPLTAGPHEATSASSELSTTFWQVRICCFAAT